METTNDKGAAVSSLTAEMLESLAPLADALGVNFVPFEPRPTDFGYTTSAELTGNPEIRESRGELCISHDEEAGQIDLSIPDRFGHTTSYTFSYEDWAMFNFLADRMTGALLMLGHLTKEQTPEFWGE